MSTHKPPLRKKVAIDWREVHRRLEMARADAECIWAPDARVTQRVLKARAQELAREPEKVQLADAQVEILEFILAQERYAVESRHVREVYPLENLTPLPCTPPFVLGIINLRSEIVSVIDIKKFFDLPEKGLTDLNKVIVLQSGPMLFGILADIIVGVRRIRAAEIQPSLPTLSGVREKYLRGITSDRTVLLDAGKLLADEQIIVQEQV
ncbi:MAG: purine-binding chemotaxis protein CheW [Gammaproteobacteria bacterium]|jgi:purine-binding chemotaxis protein CheW|nr:MAG: purine-binding chemotaxis protein CheW [Gammaproteobacteria bacterium]